MKAFKAPLAMRSSVFHRFLVAPRQTGAVAPSSRALARKLADLAFQGNPRVLVEIGAGSGAVTRELARRAAQTGARLVAVELERSLARRLGPSAVQADAAHLPVRRADVVVSGIPFASLRSGHAEAILAEAARVAPRIVLFQYTRRRLDLIEHHFPRVRAQERVRWNIPPAFAIEALAPA
jgi:phospholipid N-methyltransferase